MLNRMRIVATAKCIAGLVIGLVVFWQTADRVTRRDSGVVVHVLQDRADLMIDGQEIPYTFGLQTPVVYDLPRGHHDLRMYLQGELVYQEEFTLARGEERVLFAWNRLGGKGRVATR